MVSEHQTKTELEAHLKWFSVVISSQNIRITPDWTFIWIDQYSIMIPKHHKKLFTGISFELISIPIIMISEQDWNRIWIDSVF